MSEIEMSVEKHVFEADVARLLHSMVHSVYSDKNVFLRELISNAADACEKLRYEAIVSPELLAGDPTPRITLKLDEENNRLVVEDNGIGMSRDELVEALGTIARSGTRAFMERVEAAKSGEGAELIGQFGIGFYSTFMVADTVNNSVLCSLPTQVNTSSCNDMDVVRRQVKKTKELEAFIDARHGGPGKGWFRIAYTADEARQYIEQGE